MTAILQVRNLKKHFPIVKGFFRRTVGFVKAVDGVTLDIFPREVLGVVGESGSGKTTLARAILRLIEPTSGTLSFAGNDFTTLSQNNLSKMRKKMQIVFQNPSLSLNPRHTISETIQEILLFHKVTKNIVEAKDRVEATLKMVGLDNTFLPRYPHELSAGQQQRVAIARAICVEPELIILDECVSALDLSVQAQILNLLSELLVKMNMSYLFISHDLDVIEHIADRVIVMKEGVVIEEGDVERVFRFPENQYTKLLLDSQPAKHPRDKRW